MAAHIIDGKAVAAALRTVVARDVAKLVARGLKPGLAVVLVGNDPASEVYVRSKARQTLEAGMASFEHSLPTDVTQAELLALVAKLNDDDDVDGILVQLPLPPQIDAEKVLRAIDPAKDVDGFHPVNVGLVATGSGGIVPCTPLGSMILLKSVRADLSGLNAVIVGRSNIVGKPMCQLLLKENCTVTIAHSKSRDLPALVRAADILVAAVGQPAMIRGDWIKPGAIVIDVGINRVADGAGKTRLMGDVAFAEALEIAGAITPVPGGVGPMTIACLLRNSVDAAVARRG
ncbi:MAG: bifunctional methylenetetrahydrofolate dehydrogenase/methenyltetrahydrofolate cyclohydrolase FolD [Bradyrhizobium sp.]